MSGSYAIDYSKKIYDRIENLFDSSFIQKIVDARLKENEYKAKELANNKSLTNEIENNFDNLIPEYIPYQKGSDSFTSLQKWEGYVTDFNDKIIFAQLTDLTNNFPGEFAEIPVEEISSEDKNLLSVGAVFYWNIGYYDNVNGQRTRASIIRFQRLPKWTKNELDEADKEAEEIIKYFE